MAPDSIVTSGQVSVKTADGWLVRLTKRRRFGKDWMYDLRFFEDWHEAQACYEEPPSDWQALDIWPCREGRPSDAPLSAYKIGQLCAEARHD